MLICPECSSSDLRHHQVRRNQCGDVQRWICRACGATFSTPIANRTPRFLLIDIETAPLSIYTWGLYKQRPGPHQIIDDWFVICWAVRWLGETEITSASVTPKEARAKDDKRIMGKIWKLLDEADVIIAHNGDKFDIRKLNARFLKYDLDPPMPYQTIDTLKVLRRKFALPSYKQDYITKFLKLPEKIKTEYQLWLDCMAGDQSALDEMLTYCKGDIGGLEEMYFKIRKWVPSHPNLGIFTEADGEACPACGSGDITWTDAHYTTPVGQYRAFRCGCGAIGRSRFTALGREQKRKLTASVAR